MDTTTATQVDRIRSSTLDTETKIAKILALQNGLIEQQKNAAADRERTLRQVTTDIDKIIKSTSGVNNAGTAVSNYGTSATRAGSSASSASSGVGSFSSALNTSLKATGAAAEKLGEYKEQLDILAEPHVELVTQIKNLTGGSIALYKAQEKLGDTAGIQAYYEALGNRTALKGITADQAALLASVNDSNAAFAGMSRLIPDVMSKMTGVGTDTKGAATGLAEFNAQGMSLEEIMGGSQNVLEGYANVMNDVQLSTSFAADQAEKYRGKEAEQLAKVDFALKAYGISNGDVTEMIRRNYAATGKATTGFFDDVVKSAEISSLAFGYSSDEIVADTISMMNNVQMFGFRTPEEFARISKAARDSHASISELAGVMGKFDTFESASSAVGDLNATLGTNFDSLELMTLRYTDPVKMLQRLSEGFQETGQSFEEMFMSPERLPFLTSTLNTLGVSVEQLRALREGSASAEDLAKMQADKEEELKKKGMSTDELMKSRIAAMKDVTGGVDEMTARLDKASQLLAGSTRDLVKDTQEVSTSLLKLSNDVIDKFAIAERDLIIKAKGAYKDIITGVVAALNDALKSSQDIIDKMVREANKLIAQMKAAALMGQVFTPPATPQAGATPPAAVPDLALSPGSPTRVSRSFGGLFEDYILDSRDALVAGPPKMLDAILTQAKAMKTFVEKASEISAETPAEVPKVIREPATATATASLPTQLQARLQPIGSTLNISIDSASFIQYIMETMAKEYPV